MTTDPLPRAVGAEHLTDALRRPGALGNGRVRLERILLAVDDLGCRDLLL